MSKLKDFLDKNKIDPRRVLVASRQIEALRPADRAIHLARRQAKKEGAPDSIKEKAKEKPRSGKAVTAPLLHGALAGGTLSRLARQRITRAVNAVLEQKKKPQVSATDLF